MHLQVVRQLERIEQAQAARDGVVAGRELRAAQPEVARVPEEPAHTAAARSGSHLCKRCPGLVAAASPCDPATLLSHNLSKLCMRPLHSSGLFTSMPAAGVMGRGPRWTCMPHVSRSEACAGRLLLHARVQAGTQHLSLMLTATASATSPVYTVAFQKDSA